MNLHNFNIWWYNKEHCYDCIHSTVLRSRWQHSSTHFEFGVLIIKLILDLLLIYVGLDPIIQFLWVCSRRTSPLACLTSFSSREDWALRKIKWNHYTCSGAGYWRPRLGVGTQGGWESGSNLMCGNIRGKDRESWHLLSDAWLARITVDEVVSDCREGRLSCCEWSVTDQLRARHWLLTGHRASKRKETEGDLVNQASSENLGVFLSPFLLNYTLNLFPLGLLLSMTARNWKS
jgi:hypothetical protein